MKEIRVHGRGGQGGMAGARILATAFVREGKWAASFPEFGFERRGAPVRAFIRVDDKPVRERMKVYNPDCLLVIDPILVNSKATFEGLKPEGILVMNGADPDLHNTSSPLFAKEGLGGFLCEMSLRTLGYVNATRIGMEEIGIAATNTCMLGAFARATGWVSLDSILASLSEYFSGSLLEKNGRCVERGFREAAVIQY